ncbi:helix-turn-helix domain-containing protein [Curtanaerobium respiraculi]|uniref:helix-turn-helix domain-containing protein n=1 Tax=Curtanaerobium respiraculi TaxID=2949669 RepID=UPI0024B3C744|nr:AraC family transcriptional regulator [Curtanaerobium respiraculi]
MRLEEELSRFDEDERSVFAEQLRQLGAEPLPIAYGLLARIGSSDADGWFWAGRAEGGCVVSVKRIVQKSDFDLVEAPSCKQWRISLLADIDAKVVLDHARAQGGDAELAGFENQLPSAFRRRLLTYIAEPGRQEYRLRKGSSHHICEISILPRFMERISSCTSIDPRELERVFSEALPTESELRLRNDFSSFSVGRMRLPGAELYLRGHAYRVVADLVDSSLRGNRGRSRAGRLSDVEIAERVKASIVDDIANPLSLDELAAALLVSKTKLCDSFARSEGMTIGSYLTEKRVAAAKGLLADTDASIASIASELGFTYQNNFSAMFKRATGKSPREWRKSNSNFGQDRSI